jgi:microcystin-dependent protein
MATVTPGKVFTSNEIVTPANLNLLGTPTVALADGEVTTVKIADAAVTTPKLATSTQQALLPAGAIMPFAMNTVPTGWLAANGSTPSRTTYAALFAAIGTLYGAGDGSTTFALPDLRGYFVRGSGTNAADGTAAGTFGTKQADAVGPHTHSGTTNLDGSHTHPLNLNVGSSGSGTGLMVANSVSNENPTSTRGSISAGGSHTHAFTTTAQDPTSTTETRPRNIALLYCIKF